MTDGLKSKQIRISLNQETILSDLLEYTRKLIKNGENKENAHKLQAILQSGSVKEKQEPNNSQTPLLIGGGVVVVGLALVMGYLSRQKRKSSFRIIIITVFGKTPEGLLIKFLCQPNQKYPQCLIRRLLRK